VGTTRKGKNVEPIETTIETSMFEVVYEVIYVVDSNGAGEGARTLDTKLGKLLLYQLSYARSGVEARL
jgi:hypothetical protein